MEHCFLGANAEVGSCLLSFEAWGKGLCRSFSGLFVLEVAYFLKDKVV